MVVGEHKLKRYVSTLHGQVAGKALNWDVSWYETATRYTRYMAHPSDGLDRGAPGRGYYSSTTLSLPADGSGELGSKRERKSHT